MNKQFLCIRISFFKVTFYMIQIIRKKIIEWLTLINK